MNRITLRRRVKRTGAERQLVTAGWECHSAQAGSGREGMEVRKANRASAGAPAEGSTSQLLRLVAQFTVLRPLMMVAAGSRTRMMWSRPP